MGLDDLAVLVLHQIAAETVQHAGRAGGERRRVLAAVHPGTARVDADQADAFVRDIRMEDADGVGAAADTGDYRVGLAAGEFRHLDEAFAADHALEVAYQHGIRMRAGGRAEDVKSRLDVGHPVAHRLVQRILQRLRTGRYRHHGRAEQFHAEDVGRLAGNVLGTHVDHTFHAEARCNGSRSDAVLASAGFGDHALLAHAARQQRLADGVVDLVRASVIEILALEVDLRATVGFGESPGVIHRARTSDVVLEFV